MNSENVVKNLRALWRTDRTIVKSLKKSRTTATPPAAATAEQT